MTFSTQPSNNPPRDRMVHIRINSNQDETLTRTSERLQVGRSELVRKALDFWIANSQEAVTAVPRSRRRTN